MKKVKVNKQILESYVRKLILESTGRSAIEFEASADDTNKVLASVYSGGTDFGQAFEIISMNMLTARGYNVDDLNPQSGYSVEDSDEEKKADANAELADTIIYEGSETKENVTIEGLEDVVLLSAKANKGPKAFVGSVSKLRSKLKKLLTNRVLSPNEFTKQVKQINARLGTINISLNPRLSLEREAAMYDVLISIPKVPNIGIVGMNDASLAAMAEAREEVSGPNFKTDFLPTMLESLEVISSMGPLGQLINLSNSDPDAVKPAFISPSTTSFTKTDSSSSGAIRFVNPMSLNKFKNSLNTSFAQVDKNTIAFPSGASKTLDSTTKNELTRRLRNGEFDELVEECAVKIADLFITSIRKSVDNHNQALEDYPKEYAEFFKKIDAAATGDADPNANPPKAKKSVTNNRELTQYINRRVKADASKDAAGHLADLLAAANVSAADYNNISTGTPYSNYNQIATATKNYRVALLGAVKEATGARAINSLIGESDSKKGVLIIRENKVDNVKSAIINNIKTQFSDLSHPSHNDFFTHIGAYYIIVTKTKKIKGGGTRDVQVPTGYFGSDQVANYREFANRTDFVNIGDAGFLEETLTEKTVAELLDIDTEAKSPYADDVYLLDSNGNPVSKPKDTSSSYYDFHRSFISQVPSDQLYFRVKLNLGPEVTKNEELKKQIVAKYNELFVPYEGQDDEARVAQGIPTSGITLQQMESLGVESGNWNKLAAYNYVALLTNQELRTSLYKDDAPSPPPKREEPRFVPGTSQEEQDAYDYPKPITKEQMRELYDQTITRINELKEKLKSNLGVSSPVTEALDEGLKSLVGNRKEVIDQSGDQHRYTDAEVAYFATLWVLEAERRGMTINPAAVNLSDIGAHVTPGTQSSRGSNFQRGVIVPPDDIKENVERNNNEISVQVVLQTIINFCDYLIDLANKGNKEKIMSILDKLAEHSPGLKNALKKEKSKQPGFFSRLGSRFMQGVEDISGRFGQAVDDLGRALTPQQLAALEEQKLYEDIIVDLMEAADKKQRTAQQPKKIKVTRQQLNRMLKESFEMDLTSSIRVALSFMPLLFEELYEELALDPYYGDNPYFYQELKEEVEDLIDRGNITVNAEQELVYADY